jgi:hypothetical protein
VAVLVAMGFSMTAQAMAKESCRKGYRLNKTASA